MQHGGYGTAQREASAAEQRDPVCGMTVSPAASAGKVEYDGREYFFCSDQCRQKFEQNPQPYGAAANDSHPPGHERFYTCPVHPEVK